MTTALGNDPSARVESDHRLETDGWDDEEEHTTETRRSLVTGEFWIFVVLSVALLFFAYESGTDSFSRDDAMMRGGT